MPHKTIFYQCLAHRYFPQLVLQHAIESSPTKSYKAISFLHFNTYGWQCWINMGFCKSELVCKTCVFVICPKIKSGLLSRVTYSAVHRLCLDSWPLTQDHGLWTLDSGQPKTSFWTTRSNFDLTTCVEKPVTQSVNWIITECPRFENFRGADNNGCSTSSEQLGSEQGNVGRSILFSLFSPSHRSEDLKAFLIIIILLKISLFLDL